MLRKYISHALFFKPQRNLFIVSLEYKKSIDQVDKHLVAHREYLEECYAKNLFLASGRKVPRTGGVIIASVANQKELEAILEKDPFKKHQIADYHITEFIPTMQHDTFAHIAAADKKLRAD